MSLSLDLRSVTVPPLANSVVLHVHPQSYQDDIELRYVELIERICCDDVFLPIAIGDWMIYEFSNGKTKVTSKVGVSAA